MSRFELRRIVEYSLARHAAFFPTPTTCFESFRSYPWRTADEKTHPSNLAWVSVGNDLRRTVYSYNSMKTLFR